MRGWERLDMMSIARTVELTKKTTDGNAENENDDADAAKEKTPDMRSEFVGGEHDLEEEEGH